MNSDERRFEVLRAIVADYVSTLVRALSAGRGHGRRVDDWLPGDVVVAAADDHGPHWRPSLTRGCRELDPVGFLGREASDPHAPRDLRRLRLVVSSEYAAFVRSDLPT